MVASSEQSSVHRASQSEDEAAALGFAARLREHTARSHEDAEHSPFAVGLFDGSVAIEGYASLAAQLVHIYAALEAPAERFAGDPLVGPFVDPLLHRSAALQADLAHLRDVRGVRVSADALPATAAYAARIAEAADRWPAGWVVHHYTRYLGDLSGGRSLGGALRRQHGLENEEPYVGSSFYAFPGVVAGSYKVGYRARLDALGAQLSEDERVRALDEAVAAFHCNQAVFGDLEADRLAQAAGSSS